MAQAVTAASVGLAREFRTRLNPFNALVNYFPTQDGRWICLVMLQADRWWPDLCRHLGRPDLIDDPRFSTAERRDENVEECTRVLDEIFVARTFAEWRETLATLEAWSPVLSPARWATSAGCGERLPARRRQGRRPRLPGVASPIRFDQTPVDPLSA
jgi:crotonobetainyl-CoA:carnitine CoA-transferase CaiB-like acyl-CoA transferase